MINLLLASGNPHKAEELTGLLGAEYFKIEVSADKIDVNETGATYTENALLKAEAYYKKYKRPVLSDDSGLNVDALPDELGIRSARFGGPGLDDSGRADALLKRMSEISLEKRKAHFTSVLCFYFCPDEIFFFEGKLHGHIGEKKMGSGGFGYDPVFHPNGENNEKTVAMIPEWKAKNSHRANACKMATKFFKERVCQKKECQLS